jgi:protein-disulfide isomerase
MKRSLLSLVPLTLFLTIPGLSSRAAGAERAANVPIAATVGGRTVTLAELEEQAQGRLLRLRSEEYTLRQQVLEERIEELLIDEEAKRRRVSIAELFHAEVESKVAPVTELEARAAYEIGLDRTSGEKGPASVAEAAAALRQKRLDDRKGAFLRSLRASAGVEVLLEPPRLALRTTEAPSKGREDAPVTIVEFSEFQCPYCSRGASTLRQLEAQYGDRLRIVFRHFPLASHHEAPKAAQAALCAGEQQKFWEMHDGLFADQSHLRVADLKQRATTLGLDTARFNDCLDSGRFASAVEADLADGTRYGVTGTPAFFINGRPLVGAVPYENFTRLIDEELARSAAKPRSLASP